MIKIRNYFKEALKEFKHVSFPTVKETYTSTIIIFVAIICFAIFLTLVDYTISTLIGFIL